MKMNMNDRLAMVVRSGAAVEVIFRSEQITEALRVAGDYTRYELTLDLLRLWLERSQETKEVFWETLRYERGEQVYFSLTADGRQLRIWDKRPDVDRARPDHVDSSGLGGHMLFEVLGPPPSVRQYLEGLLTVKPLKEKVLRNGIRFYE